MARLDRYMLSQLMMLFGFFSLVLIMVYWVNRAVILFDQLIADGQSAGVFLEFTALSLPNVIRLVLPLSAFAASVYVTNRLSSESELTVMQATGHSAVRLARPVIVFGLLVTGLMMILTHVLVPTSLSRLNDREAEIAENVTARLLTEGTFLNPASGITFYVREISASGELLDIFLTDTRNPEQQITYTAEQSFLVRSDNGPQLVMINGLAQTLTLETQRLTTTTFADSTFDIGGLIDSGSRGRVNIREVATMDLLYPTQEIRDLTRRDDATLIHEGHGRFIQALLAVVAALVGFSTLLTGGFSRFGIWKQIVIAIFLLIAIKTVESVAVGAIRGQAHLWPVIYTPIAVGLVISAAQLYWADHPGLFKQRARGFA